MAVVVEVLVGAVVELEVWWRRGVPQMLYSIRWKI